MTRTYPRFPGHRLLGRFARHRRGAIAVEFALIAPVMLIMLAGVTDIGRALYVQCALENSVRAGLQYGYVQPTDTTNIAKAAQNASALQNPSTSVVVTSRNYCTCSEAPTVEVVCTASCANDLRKYVEVRAAYAYTPIFSTWGMIANPITARAAFRYQ